MSLPTYEQALATAREGSPFSNGTEGEAWQANWCNNCVHDRDLRRGEGSGCVLVAISFEDRTPAEWFQREVYGLGTKFTCVMFRSEDDGPDPEPTPIPDPPGQLTLLPREPYTGVRMFAPTTDGTPANHLPAGVLQTPPSASVVALAEGRQPLAGVVSEASSTRPAATREGR